MTTETIHASAVIDAKPAVIYEALLDGDKHTAMTGGGATSTPRVGTRFTAWDGYITGKHVELQPRRRIVQDWRTTQFPASAPDSRLIILLDAEGGSTRVTFVHLEIPQGQGASYESGWEKHYFAPMRLYFAIAEKKKKASTAKKSTAKKTAAKNKTVAKKRK